MKQKQSRASRFFKSMACSLTEAWLLPVALIPLFKIGSPMAQGLVAGTICVSFLALHVLFEYVLLWPDGPKTTKPANENV
ncbi:MAG: hypothetical protein JST12_03220 [Armatimonadetes bacterium]|nr:hypothetical protein [Armatimonadota bacterium]